MDHSSVKSLYSTLKTKSMTSTRKCDDVKDRNKEVPPLQKGNHPDYRWKCSATTAYRAPFVDGKDNLCVRDPATGTWFRDQPGKRRDYFHTGNLLDMKVREAAADKATPTAGVTHEPVLMWTAPCAGGVWLNRYRDAPRSTIVNSTGDISGGGNMWKSRSVPALTTGYPDPRRRRGIDSYSLF